MVLNAKQRIFVREYLRDKNASRSYRVAYGNPKGSHVSGVRLLGNAKVREAVDKGLAKIEAKLEISAERVLSVLADFAFMPLTQKEMKNSAAINKIRAAEMLAKHFKLLTDVQEVSGKDGGPIIHLTMPANGSEADDNG